ncbi:2-hexaprenyl-6-methoxy-1,4-benzoquinone methyltransferase [Dispira simplex]|nr:2-hexaprenyl-6-methoxy-1,4-benzoquinone methyltransferase [Dispira simplex]
MLFIRKASLASPWTRVTRGLIHRPQGQSPQPFIKRTLTQYSVTRLPAKSNDNTNVTSDSSSTESNYTHFGYREVPETDKERLVGQVFSNVASKYDIMNDVMSAGIHRVWKDQFIRRLAPTPGTRLLDVAGGTGDIALRFLNYCQNVHQDTTSQVHLVDINPDMVNEGRKRFQNSAYELRSQVSFEVGNAEDLATVASNSMDAYTIAFGIRNCTHVDRVVQEAYRVLKPGGRFMCLEFSHVENTLLAQVYDMYSFEVIPAMGQIVTADRDSYQYLVESIRRFPKQEDFAAMIRNAGFYTVGKGYENLTFGVAAIHSGFKL